MRQPTKIWSWVVGYAIIGLLGALGLRAQVRGWPAIRPLRQAHTFVSPGEHGEDTPFLAFIRDTRGVPVYKFECHNGNYDDQSEMNFSGDFQCALFAIKGRRLTSGDLLAANTKDELSTDWWNRGRVLSRQFRGKCLAYPEYSTDRRFRFRGMLIAMRFTDIAWSARKDQQGNPMLAKFTFTLDVVPDRGAQSSRAELPAGAKPPTSCYP